MLPVSKEVEEKMSESMGEQPGKDLFIVTDELQSFEDEGELVQKPNLEYANAAVTKDGNVQEPSTYEEATQREEWSKAMEEKNSSFKAKSNLRSCAKAQGCETHFF